MKIWLSVLAGIALVLSLGCRQTNLARQQARKEFRDRIAAIKVAAEGSTYAEFRDRMLAAETWYAANQTLLPDDQKENFVALSLFMNACNTCWRKSELHGDIYSGDTHFLYTKEERAALAIINPSITNKFNLPTAQRFSDHEFDATFNTKLALTEISMVSDQILTNLTN